MEKVQSGAGAASAGSASASQNASTKAAFDSSIKAAQTKSHHGPGTHGGTATSAGAGSSANQNTAAGGGSTTTGGGTGGAPQSGGTSSATPTPPAPTTPQYPPTPSGGQPDIDQETGRYRYVHDLPTNVQNGLTDTIREGYNPQRGEVNALAYKDPAARGAPFNPQVGQTFDVDQNTTFTIQNQRPLTADEKQGVVDALKTAQAAVPNSQGHVDYAAVSEHLDKITVNDGQFNNKANGQPLNGNAGVAPTAEQNHVFVNTSSPDYGTVVTHEVVHALQFSGAIQVHPQQGDYDFTEVAGGRAMGHLDIEDQAVLVESAYRHNNGLPPLRGFNP